MAVHRGAHARRLSCVALTIVALLTIPGTGAASIGAPDPSRVLGVTMTISGRITDQNTGQGVAGMCVSVETDSGDATTSVATTTSASDGTYVAIWSQSRSTAPEGFGVHATPYCGADGWWLATPNNDEQVTLTAEPGKSSASGVDMQTTPAGRITGRVTDDNTGRPVAKVSVSWTARDVSAPLPNTTVREVVSQSDGTFVVGGLPAGTYAVVINKTDWTGRYSQIPIRSQIDYLPDLVHHTPETSVSNAEAFSVSVGQSTVVNESIYPTDSITGTVTDAATGLPISGVTVIAWGGGIWDDYGVYTPGTTDATGKYRIDGLGPGAIVVCFEPGATVAAGVPSYQAACWKNRPNDFDAANPVQVDGFGTLVSGIDQALTLAN
jgi:5-hydroxyisourate hydrolase-like protein (transthyretin family)